MTESPHLRLALVLAKKAGVIMRENFTLNMSKEWKEDATPVTKTDLDINDLVLKEIKKAYPEHSILSEEGDDFSEKSEYVWICDPVDGTHNFSHGIPTATFALALTQKGEAVLGVIYDPFLDRLFYAEKGLGAFLNGKPIHVSDNPLLKKSLVGMGKMKGVRTLFPVMAGAYEHGSRIITGLSIHYMMALVACGEFSAALFGGTSPHDMTAGKIIIEEAGGRVTDLFGKEHGRTDRDMEGQIATNGLLHTQVLDLFSHTV